VADVHISQVESKVDSRGCFRSVDECKSTPYATIGMSAYVRGFHTETGNHGLSRTEARLSEKIAGGKTKRGCDLVGPLCGILICSARFCSESIDGLD
jgi:hypothetical protein